jgi:hypothetical protein
MHEEEEADMAIWGEGISNGRKERCKFSDLARAWQTSKDSSRKPARLMQKKGVEGGGRGGEG